MAPYSGVARAPLPPIRFAELADALLASADTLVPNWLPGGKREGHEYKCASLQGGAGTSTSINLTNGRWADFATGEQGGDLLSLYGAMHGLTMTRAALQVAREEGLQDVAGIVHTGADGATPAPRPARPPAAAPKPHREDDGWQPVLPVPVHAPAPNFKHPFRAADDLVHRAEYRHGADLLGFVLRFRTSDGGKDTLPYTWCQSARDGAARWVWKTWTEPRPLFLPGFARPLPGTTVVLVEGEKKADILQALLAAGAAGVYTVASWPGGCKAWKKADWAPLAGCNVLLWADCDAKRVPLTPTERKACADDAALAAAVAAKPLQVADKQPGMAAMLGIGALLQADHGCTVQLLPIPAPGSVADGWDCADAIEADGWDYAAVAAFFAKAGALPAPAAPDASPAPSGAPAAKKIDGPGGPVAGGGGGGGDGGFDGAGDADAGSALPWWLVPYWDADKRKFMVSRKLVISALTHDEALAGVLGKNELSSNIDARRAWPWPHGKAGAIAGNVDLALGLYLSKSYGLPAINRAALMEAIETVAHEHPFHPVRDYLQALPWDGTARLDKWLVHALGESPETLMPAMAEYLSRVGRYILLGMVWRVMEPGCKWDYCPVLEGPGGLGKSTLVETLAGSAWFSDTHFDVARGKDGQEQVQGIWIYEIAELSNFGKAEINLIKAFITAKVDRYRPAYGRVVESYPRQCVMFGTTNESTYLRDRTGNRRFWPVPVLKEVRIPWVARVREQLLAEAYALYLQGVDYTPSRDEEERLFVPMQESRLVETAVLSELLNLLTRDPTAGEMGQTVNNLTNFITIAQLTRALGVDAAKSNAALEGQIRSWMEHEGWQRVKRQQHGVRAWGYERPKDWPLQALDNTDNTGHQPKAGPSISTAQEDDDEPF